MAGVMVYDQVLSNKQGEVALCADMVAQRARMHGALGLRPGERVLEIGSGNGIMAREMAETVGKDGWVTGVDISSAMVTQARAHCVQFPNAFFVEGDAVALPIPSGSSDVVTITQCLCFVSDLEAAVAEIHRVLRAGGRVVILETDWDTLVWNSSNPALMKRVMDGYKAAYADAFLPRRLGKLLEGAGITVTGHDQFAMLNWRYEPDSYSGHLIEFTKELVQQSNKLNPEELIDWEKSIMATAERNEYFFSLNRYIFACSK
jgi:ubiquinone/menaquinone biosynthesis C-methylase UbiE